MPTEVYYALSALGGVIAGGAALWTLVTKGAFERHVRSSRNVNAELEAKDRTIATNEQTIRALAERVETLEHQVSQLSESLATATTAVRGLEERYRALELFAAPQAFQQIDVKLDALLEKELSPEERALVSAKLAAIVAPPRRRAV